MRDADLMIFNSNPDQVGSVGGDLEPITIPCKIYEYLLSRQSLNAHTIT